MAWVWNTDAYEVEWIDGVTACLNECLCSSEEETQRQRGYADAINGLTVGFIRRINWGCLFCVFSGVTDETWKLAWWIMRYVICASQSAGGGRRRGRGKGEYEHRWTVDWARRVREREGEWDGLSKEEWLSIIPQRRYWLRRVAQEGREADGVPWGLHG